MCFGSFIQSFQQLQDTIQSLTAQGRIDRVMLIMNKLALASTPEVPNPGPAHVPAKPKTVLSMSASAGNMSSRPAPTRTPATLGAKFPPLPAATSSAAPSQLHSTPSQEAAAASATPAAAGPTPNAGSPSPSSTILPSLPTEAHLRRALQQALLHGLPTAIESAHGALVRRGFAPDPLVLAHVLYLYTFSRQLSDVVRVLTALHAIKPVTFALVHDLSVGLSQQGIPEVAQDLLARLQDSPLWSDLAHEAFRNTRGPLQP
jgi:hypothetical protein